MDERWEDIQIGYGGPVKRYRGSFRTMAIRRPHLRQVHSSAVFSAGRRIRKRKSRVSTPFNFSKECSGKEDQPPQKEKTEAEIHAEIQAIIRQITASVTFLPMLEGRCTFNVLVYADADANVPDEEWGDS